LHPLAYELNREIVCNKKTNRRICVCLGPQLEVNRSIKVLDPIFKVAFSYISKYTYINRGYKEMDLK